MYFSVVLLVLSLAVVVLSSHLVMRAFGSLFSDRLKGASAAMFVALSASLPELFIGISASMQNVPELALGNILGSCILDITLIAGIGIIIARSYSIKSRVIKKDTVMMFFLAALPLVLMLLGKQLSRIDGIVLVCAFIAYLIIMVRKNEIRSSHKKVALPIAVILFFGIALIASSYISIVLAVETFSFLNTSLIVIGLVLVALGSSLPELSFTIKSLVRHPHGELCLEEIIDSVVVNSTGVLGIIALMTPITAEFTAFLTASVFLILSLFLFTVFVEREEKLSVSKGVLLILVYIFFIIVQVFLP